MTSIHFYFIGLSQSGFKPMRSKMLYSLGWSDRLIVGGAAGEKDEDRDWKRSLGWMSGRYPAFPLPTPLSPWATAKTTNGRPNSFQPMAELCWSQRLLKVIIVAFDSIKCTLPLSWYVLYNSLCAYKLRTPKCSPDRVSPPPPDLH